MDTLDDEGKFSEKLNRLFEEYRKPDGTRYSQKEVLESAPGVLTRINLWRLRKGKASRPSYPVVKALADFFGVEPSYFFDRDRLDVESMEQDERKDLATQIALRSSGLDLEGQKAVLLMIEAIRKSKE